MRLSQSQNRRGRQHLGTLPHFSRRVQSKIVLTLILASISVSVSLQFSMIPAQGTTAYSAMIVDYAFQPQHINVTTGTQVTWTYSANGKTVHTVTSTPQTNTTQGGTPLISSGSLNPGQSFSYIFYSHGFYPIQCYLHPSIVAMNGWVNVTGSDVQPPPPGGLPTTPVNYVQYAVIAAIVGFAIVMALVGYMKLRVRRRKAVSENPMTSTSKT